MVWEARLVSNLFAETWGEKENCVGANQIILWRDFKHIIFFAIFSYFFTAVVLFAGRGKKSILLNFF